VSYEAIRKWCLKFGDLYARCLRKKHQGYSEVVDVLLQTRRNTAAAKRFFQRVLKSSGISPRKIVTDKLRSYGAAQREMGGTWIHDTSQYSNNRAEQSHQPNRNRERGMKKFRSIKQAQPFLNVHATVNNLFNLGRHLTTAKNYQNFGQIRLLSGNW